MSNGTTFEKTFTPSKEGPLGEATEEGGVQYEVLSPDGISIEFDRMYNSKEEALMAAQQWAQRYEQQGYYSSNKGQIPYEYILNECDVVAYKDGNEIDKFELYWLLPEDKQEPYF